MEEWNVESQAPSKGVHLTKGHTNPSPPTHLPLHCRKLSYHCSNLSNGCQETLPENLEKLINEDSNPTGQNQGECMSSQEGDPSVIFVPMAYLFSTLSSITRDAFYWGFQYAIKITLFYFTYHKIK